MDEQQPHQQQHPVTTPFLYIQLEPRDARPTLQSIVQQLSSCTPFRFHNHQDSTDPERPHYKQIEFQQLENAQKAYAIKQNIQITNDAREDSTTPTIHLSLSIKKDPTSDIVPPDGTKLHISQLPPSHCTKEALYDLFKPFGPIYRIELGQRDGTARVTYYEVKSSNAAIEDLNYTDVDGSSLLVRKPTVHDKKDTFKSSGFSTVDSPAGGGGGRRAFSAGSSGGEAPKKQYNYASGHRATCGIGPRPYGLSANAEPYDPLKRRKSQDATPPPLKSASASASAWRSPSNSSSSSSSPAPTSSSPLLESSPGVPLVIRSVSRPLSLADPNRLIIQNVPLELKAAALYMALRSTFDKYTIDSEAAASDLDIFKGADIKIQEASLAIDEGTDTSLGIAVIRLENKEQALLALKILNGHYLDGFGDDEDEEGGKMMPLRVKLFEPRGYIEKGLQLRDRKQSNEVVRAQDQENKKEESTQTSEDPLELSLKAASVVDAPSTTPSSAPATTNNMSSINKHRKLLSTALDDLSPNEAKSLFRSEREKHKLLDLLATELIDQERKKSIFEEEYLIEKCEKFKASYWNDEEDGEIAKMNDSGTLEGTQQPELSRKGSESPSRVYDRKQLLELYSPHSPTHEKTEAMIRAISPRTSTALLPPTSPSNIRKPRNNKSKDMTMDELVKLSVEAIIDLASGPHPPKILAQRDAEIVKSVEAFMEGIEGLNAARKKQKVGEKVFKVLKSKAAGMKSMSKRTVTLLDTEDLAALMHLTEEYPEVLVAKAISIVDP